MGIIARKFLWIQLHWKIFLRLNTTYLDLFISMVVLSLGIILVYSDRASVFHGLGQFHTYGDTHSVSLEESTHYLIYLQYKLDVFRREDLYIYSLAFLCLSAGTVNCICTVFFYDCRKCLLFTRIGVSICLLFLLVLKTVYFHDGVTPVIIFGYGCSALFRC